MILVLSFGLGQAEQYFHTDKNSVGSIIVWIILQVKLNSCNCGTLSSINGVRFANIAARDSRDSNTEMGSNALQVFTSRVHSQSLQ